jgi:hypothetical protein
MPCKRAKRAIAQSKRAGRMTIAVVELRPKHARQRRLPWQERGWLTPSEFAAVTCEAVRTVQDWCARGWLLTLERVGHDHRIPVDELYRLNPRLKAA